VISGSVNNNCNSPCQTSASSNGQNSTLTGTATGGFVAIGVEAHEANFTCSDGGRQHATVETTWLTSGFSGTTKTVVARFPVVPGFTSPSNYAVCYSQGAAWNGPGPNGSVVVNQPNAPGLLGNCDTDNDINTDPNDSHEGEFPPPCLRSVTISTGIVTETVVVSADDAPRMY
jgi:hypothetical protein